MSFRLKEADCKTLECIADHRMLTVTQFAAIFRKSGHVVRRRLCDLEKEGLVEVVGHEYGRRRGRPENSLGLTEQGVDILRDKGLIDRTVPYDRVVAGGIFCASHQLLLNWFRIHLTQVERVLSRLSVRFLALPLFAPRPRRPRIDQRFFTCARPAHPGSPIHAGCCIRHV